MRPSAAATHRIVMYADGSTVRDARAQYFSANGFSDAEYTSNWVTIAKLGPIPLGFPNTASRKRAVPLHDLHHVATGYTTTWIGESEIGAWEIAGGCGKHLAAWVLNAFAFSYGVAIAPRRIYRAFMRGRKSCTLYNTGWDDSLLELSVGELRQKLALDRADEAAPSWRDRAAFGFWILLVSAPAAIVAAIAIARTL